MREAMRISNTSDTHFEKILASYVDEHRENYLTETEKEFRTRWETAFTLLLNKNSREQTKNFLMEIFNISAATAYRDIANSISLFGDVNKSKKEGWRYIVFEYNHQLLQLATAKQELDAMGRCLDRMIKLADLNKEDLPFNPEKLSAMVIQVNLSKGTEKAISEALSKGVVDLNNFQAIDIDHEEIGEDANQAN